MPNVLEDISQETLEAIAKATSGLLASTGIQGVDLSPLVSQIPLCTPARDSFPREIAGMGSQTATWEALLNINNQQANPAVGRDYAGNLVKLTKVGVSAPYQPIAVAGRVTQTAIAQARNYADALAVAELQTMNQVLIGQDCHIINSQAWALPTAATPTASTATTGGTIASGATVLIKVAYRSGFNYFYGGSGVASSTLTKKVGTTTTTNTVTATATNKKGVGAYDWFVTGHYYTTTTTSSVTITKVPTAALAVPNLPLICKLSTKAPTAPPTLDTSYSANNYNGILATTLGDYSTTGKIVTPTTGAAVSGATWLDAKGSSFTLNGAGVAQIDEALLTLWNAVQLSATAIMLNAQQGEDLSQIVLGTSAATTFLPASDAQARMALVAGGFVGMYVNRAAGGVQVPVEIHPRLAPGTMVVRTDRVPFPGSGIGSVFKVRCQYDTARFTYGANYNPGVVGGGPRNDFEIRSMETLINQAPVAQAIVTNIAQSTPV